MVSILVSILVSNLASVGFTLFSISGFKIWSQILVSNFAFQSVFIHGFKFSVIRYQIWLQILV